MATSATVFYPWIAERRFGPETYININTTLVSLGTFFFSSLRAFNVNLLPGNTFHSTGVWFLLRVFLFRSLPHLDLDLMPRIPHSLLLNAHNISPLLPLVLRATGTLSSAIRELRWLSEHVQEQDKPPSLSKAQQKQQLLRLCKRRQRGEPLQYILGSQPFGDFNIKCRPGVLIPRHVNAVIYDVISTDV